MTDAAASSGSEGQTLDDRYRLDALLDTGTGRTLWRATDLQNQQTVSVQMWSKDASPAERTMTAARLRQPEEVHPVFVTMEWSGRTGDGCAYSVHPSLAGRYLETWLAGHTLTAAEALELAAELTGALATLHKSGTVHGLVNPDALIVIQAEGEAPTLRIVDTGIESQPAVPHGSAVKAELQKTGKVLELLASMVGKEGGPESATAVESLKTVAKRAGHERGVAPIESMATLDEVVQPLATATPGRRTRGGARKVVSTMDFSENGSGLRAASLGPQAKKSALAETQEAEAVPLPDDLMPSVVVLEMQMEQAQGGGVDVTEAMSSLLIPASSLPPGPPPDQMLPEDAPLDVLPAINFTAPQPPPQPASPQAPAKGKKGKKAKPPAPVKGGAASGPTPPSGLAVPVGSTAGQPKKKATMIMASPLALHATPGQVAPMPRPPSPPSGGAPKPPPPSGGGTPPRAERGLAVVVVAAALVLLIALFVFVLLPQEDKLATPMEAVLVAAAEINNAAPDVVVTPEVTMPEPGPDAAAVIAEADTLEAAADVSAEAAVDVAPEVLAEEIVTADTAPEPDTQAQVDTEAPKDTEPVDTALPETVAPETVAPETVAPETVVPDIVVAETIALEVALPETSLPTEPEPPPGVPAPALPGHKDVMSPDQLMGSLKATETVIKRTRSDGQGDGVTALLQARLVNSFADGKPITLHLRGMYYLAMKMFNEGSSLAAVQAAIVTAHDNNTL